jgi:hypothetical protein
MKADGHKSKANEIKNSIEKKRGQSVMMPRHHPETMKLIKVISWQAKNILSPPLAWSEPR